MLGPLPSPTSFRQGGNITGLQSVTPRNSFRTPIMKDQLGYKLFIMFASINVGAMAIFSLGSHIVRTIGSFPKPKANLLKKWTCDLRVLSGALVQKGHQSSSFWTLYRVFGAIDAQKGQNDLDTHNEQEREGGNRQASEHEYHSLDNSSKV
ncbi:hypothetical protein F5050DRAFT_1715423 [Lentinula boryana]|uniref:Uncharacterized protein n=1 Tax=Lentinula boryana TaxID=40481 RepID=A0ABQ8Q0K1_9AGAR|nr:hypothetical protein F5050DRAFT_1715423 [Lentinula boryana]